MELEIRVLRERCILCGDCVSLCPQSGEGTSSSVFVMLPEGDEVTVENPSSCIGCMTCVEFCRAAAIVVSGEARVPEDQPDIFPSRPTSRII